MSEDSGADQRIDSGLAAAGGAPSERRSRWLGFWPWLYSTLGLAVVVAALGWYLATREPEIVEVEGPTPPPADPAPELVREAEELNRQIALKQEELREGLEALDPPYCEAPASLDEDLLRQVRLDEEPNVSRWRSLLVPAELEGEASAPVTLKRRGPAPEDGEDAQQARLTSPDQSAGEIAALSTAALRSRLEKSSAIILGLARSRSGRRGQLLNGSGFFISPRLLVTNRHVIERADPERILVTSESFDHIQIADIVAVTPKSDAGRPDFAVLRLREGRAPGYIPVSTGTEKLMPVIAAGYPGIGLGTDSGFHDLLRGDLAAAPDLNINRGEIRSIREFGQTVQIVHTADVLGGYSGGPLVDACGRVLGVNTLIQVDREQASKLNYAIASSVLIDFLRRNKISAKVDRRRCKTG